MIAPLIPYAIKGTIWFQGESGTGLASPGIPYDQLFELMINDWRKQWGQGDFPFPLRAVAQWFSCHARSARPTR